MYNYLYIEDNTLINISIFLFFVLIVSIFLLISYKNKKNKDTIKVYNQLKKIQQLTEEKKHKNIKSTPINKILNKL